MLLVERDTHPFRGGLALPGGFVRPDEGLDAAAIRRLEAETGLRRDVAHVEQLGAFGRPDRDPRMRVVSVAYLVFAADLPAPRPGPSTRSVGWVAGRAGRRRAGSPSTTTSCSPPGSSGPGPSWSTRRTPRRSAREEFTVAELRRVYEATWGTALDPRNFHRKVTGTPGFLVPVGRGSAPGPGGGRPAALFRRGTAGMLHPAMLRPSREREMPSREREIPTRP